MAILAKIIGIAGVLFITVGIYAKKRVNQDWVFAAGGLLLLIYSLYLGDIIFVALQIIFTLASLLAIYKIKSAKK